MKLFYDEYERSLVWALVVLFCLIPLCLVFTFTLVWEVMGRSMCTDWGALHNIPTKWVMFDECWMQIDGEWVEADRVNPEPGYDK